MNTPTLVTLILCSMISTGAADKPSEQAKRLIDRLAVSEGKAKRPAKEYYKAAEELENLGAAALPHLMEGLKDERPSVPFLRTRDQTVGVACRSIIMELIYPLPDSYPGSLYRRGPDGTLQERPVFFTQIWGTIGEDDKLIDWLTARKDNSLREIQIETLAWALKVERKIGAKDQEERARYIEPLEKRLLELKTEAEQSWNGMPEMHQGWSREPSFALAFWRQSVHSDVVRRRCDRAES